MTIAGLIAIAILLICLLFFLQILVIVFALGLVVAGITLMTSGNWLGIILIFIGICILKG